MKEVAIVSALRTPVGKFQGKLASFEAARLAALVIRDALASVHIAPADVDECIFGNVLQAGQGQNPARQAAIYAGLPNTVPAVTVNKVCGSGLKSIAFATQAIQTGDAEIVVAGGMESMSNAPYLLPQARTGYRLGDKTVVDSMIRDGLWDVYNDYHMGMTAENIARRYKISRERQDEHASESHRRAAAATASGAFGAETVRVELPVIKGSEPAFMDADESIRADTSVESLARLKPASVPDGTVTAGNSSGLNDGAAAVVLMSSERAAAHGISPIAVVRAQASSGTDPAYMGMAPVDGVRRLLQKLNWSLEDVDLFELNEAFSVQSLAVRDQLGIDMERLNINGGAVALGHPIKASGARVLTTLVHALHRYNKQRGIAALCIGGGNSVALAIERT